jgi:hypothetical protein
MLPLEAEPAHDLVGGGAGGHDDALAACCQAVARVASG